MRLVQPFVLSLRTGFVIGMGLTLVPLLLVAAGSTVAVQRSFGQIHVVVEEASEELTVFLRLQVLLERANSALRGCAATAARWEEGCGFRAAREVVDTTFEQAATAPFALPQERELLDAAREHWRGASEIGEAILVQRGIVPIGSGEIAAIDARIKRAIDILERAHQLGESEMSASVISVQRTRETTLWLIVATFGLGSAIASVGATIMARSILKPVTALARGAERFAAGNLGYRVSASKSKYVELAHLGSTFNLMADALAKNHAALVSASTHDGLTNVYNHREFKRCLSVEIERWRRSGQPFDVLLLDIDGFKGINDTCGHQAGDEVLRRVAAVLAEAVRPTDLVARYGGDEFVILLPRTSQGGALAIAERIRTLIETTLDAPTGLPKIRASVGVAGCPEDAESEEELIRRADIALYEAKRMGGNHARAAATNAFGLRASPFGLE